MKRLLALLLSLVLLCCGSLLPGTADSKGALGDVDNNGAVNAIDALQTLKHAVQLITLAGNAFWRGEVDGDNVINAADALLILQYAVKRIEFFPKELIEVTDYNTSKAYEKDKTADCSFSVTTGGLEEKTIYVLESTLCSSPIPSFPLDAHRLIASLQGLVNRDFDGVTHTSLIFFRGSSDEDIWLEYMQQKGKFLEGYRIVSVKTFNKFLDTFWEQIDQCGIVLWDPNAPATANVAATICGIDGQLPVQYDPSDGSLYSRLLNEFGESLVKYSLVDAFTQPYSGQQKTFKGFTYTSSGSVKCDPYLWAIQAYLPRCSSKYMAYVIDGSGAVSTNPTYTTFRPNYAALSLDNHDYFIARRCFFFDLSPIGDEPACDDPDQTVGTDLATMKAILQARYDRAKGTFGQLFGFPPWTMKYTSNSNPAQGKNDAIFVEWSFVDWCSAYNMAVEADAPTPANLYNASVYYKYVPSHETYQSNHPTEKLTFDPNTYYYTLYVGDFDSAIWMKYYVERYWMKENSRGDIPLAWAFNPNLSDRLPMLFDYVYENKTENDYFITGDSGAGYVVPTHLLTSSSKRTNPDGTAAYVRYALPYYQKFDMSITGFILNTFQPINSEIRALYNQLSPAGSLDGPHMSADGPLVIYNGVPYQHLVSGISDKTRCSEEMYSHMLTNRSKGSNFMAIRFVVEHPDFLKTVVEEYEAYCAEKGFKVKYVDPETLFDLIKQSGQGKIINS